MPETYTPHQVGQLLGVNSYTVRRWCADYAAHLSSRANPGPGNARRLTTQDVEVLREVHRMRSEGLQKPAINARLHETVFPAAIVESPQAAQEGQGEAIAPVAMVLEVMRSVEARLTALEQATDSRLTPLEAQRLRFDVVFITLIAFALGLILGLAVWWFR